MSDNSEIIKLFYIGDDFYYKSSTFMSSIYEEETWKRWDWGFVSIALREGKSINIRPATDDEMGKAYKMLKNVEQSGWMKKS